MMKRRSFLTGLSTLGMLSSLPLAWKAFALPRKELTLFMADSNVGKSLYPMWKPSNGETVTIRILDHPICGQMRVHGDTIEAYTGKDWIQVGMYNG